MTGELRRVLRKVRDTLLSEPVSPRVDSPEDINNHWCRYVAETVVERLSDDAGVCILADGANGFAHVWLACEGRHYDAECIEGVAEYTALPFFQRHPEAVLHVEPGATDQEALRKRGGEPLYPDI